MASGIWTFLQLVLGHRFLVRHGQAIPFKDRDRYFTLVRKSWGLARSSCIIAYGLSNLLYLCATERMKNENVTQPDQTK